MRQPEGCFMHALTLPAEIEEATCGWHARKRAREQWLASVILLDLQLLDLQDEVEGLDLPGLNTPGRDLAFRILQAEP
jgi:hypothetical protein